MKVKKNYLWIGLAVIIIIIAAFLIFKSGVGVTGNVVAEDFVSYMNSILDSEVKLIDVSKYEDTGLYIVLIEYQGQEIPVYVTKDGSYYATNLLPIEKQEEVQPLQNSQDIAQSDKPVLEAFVSPFCPYGLQYMKGLVPVFELLKDRVDINIRHIGITHMSLEKPETMRQLCILSEYNKEKLFAYLKNTIYDKDAEICYNDWHSGENKRDDNHFNECMGSIITKVFNKISVDENKINNCIENKGEDYFNSAVEYSRSQNVRGSPTPKINGVKVSGRSPELIKNAICNAFNEKPEECSIELSSSTPSPGIGGESGVDTGAQC